MPNGHDDCADQIRQGSKVFSLGCGTLLRPRAKLNNQYFDLIETVQNMLQNYTDFKGKCTEWCKKLESIGTGEGLCLAVEGLRRLIAGVVIQKECGKWAGWTQSALARENKRQGARGQNVSDELEQDRVSQKGRISVDVGTKRHRGSIQRQEDCPS